MCWRTPSPHANDDFPAALGHQSSRFGKFSIIDTSVASTNNATSTFSKIPTMPRTIPAVAKPPPSKTAATVSDLRARDKTEDESKNGSEHVDEKRRESQEPKDERSNGKAGGDEAMARPEVTRPGATGTGVACATGHSGGCTL